jgi:hypothetical protein
MEVFLVMGQISEVLRPSHGPIIVMVEKANRLFFFQVKMGKMDKMGFQGLLDRKVSKASKGLRASQGSMVKMGRMGLW